MPSIDPGGGDAIDLFVTVAASSAILFVMGVSLVQSDMFSRFLLSAPQLQERRFREYLYRWEKSLEIVKLRCYYYLAGGIGEGAGNESTAKILDEEEMKDLIDGWIKSNESCWMVLGINRDISNDEKELYLEFENRIQVPFVTFGLLLSQAFEDQITTTALCFIADASSGLGTRLVEGLLSSSKAGVAVLQEPAWMAAFAALVREKVIRKENMERVLFGLCRLEAYRVRDRVGDARTVLFTLPGQSTVPILAPMLQVVFPEDRHVFAYDGCVRSLQRAQYLRNTAKSGAGVLPSFDECASFKDITTRITTPMQRYLQRSLFGLPESLSKLPLLEADVVECWMMSVDAFFKLKEEENKNGYLPYVLRCDYLVNDKDDFHEINDGYNQNNKTDRYWSLTSLLQFITGWKSKGVENLPNGMMDACMEWLRDFSRDELEILSRPSYPTIKPKNKKIIEECVFHHKEILIEDKTLKDTVRPSKHWTLKQATRKGGCACCDPEDEDDEEEESSNNNDNAFGTKRDKYVDGKTTFAFDPTAFST